MSRRKSKTTSYTSRSYTRRSTLGALTATKSKSSVNIVEELVDVALIAAGAFAAAKGTAKLSEVLPSGNKIVELAAPAVVTLVGVGAGAMMESRPIRALGKGIAVGGAVKLAEKALDKPNLLSGLDENDGYEDLPELLPEDGTIYGLGRPPVPGLGQTMTPGIGTAHLPVIQHMDVPQGVEADATGIDYHYRMPRRPEVSGTEDDETEDYTIY
jgi:hypothetical protein